MVDKEENAGLYRLQTVNLEMIRLFDRICGEQDWTYYAVGGTLLGAVRHQGFIPWDDDVDLVMPRPDYNQFLKTAQDLLPEGYRLRTIRLDDDNRSYLVRLEDLSVSMKREYYTKGGIEEKTWHAWVDIFPLDGAPSDAQHMREHVERIRHCRRMISLSLMDRCMGVAKERGRIDQAVIKAGLATGAYKLVDTGRWYHNLVRECRRYPYETSAVIGNSLGIYGEKEFVSRGIFGDPSYLPFEDMEIACPADPDAYLRHIYGDYMTLPPEEDRKGHEIIFDEDD